MKSYTLFRLRHLGAYLKGFWTWRKLAKAAKKEHPYCAICGSTKRLEVHHIYPRHLYPERTLDPSNLIVLCHSCHFKFGHLGDWEAYNPNVRLIANLVYPWQVRGYRDYKRLEESKGRPAKSPHIHI